MSKKNKRELKEMPPDMIRWLLSLPKDEGIKLFEKVKRRAHLEKDKTLKIAFENGILTKGEYEKKYRDMFYDDYGMDSFIQYLDAIIGDRKVDCFVTHNERMLSIKEKLKERFGLRVASSKEILEETENRKK